MKTDNELIAEFMGARASQHGNDLRYYFDPDGFLGSGWYHVDYLQFEKNWNWLMPVVEKINGMGKMVNINFYTDPMCIETVIYNWGFGDPQQRSGVECNSPIESVYKAVVEFIKWHNQQSK